MNMLSSSRCFEQCTFIIFGATGDLTKRKLLPALYKLIEDQQLCSFTIIGVSFDKVSKQTILDQAKPFIKARREEIFTKLSNAFHFYQMDFYDRHAYEGLKNLIEELEEKNKFPQNRIFYFATMPDHFVVITKQLVEHGIVTKYDESDKNQRSWSRVVYEKPFGNNLASSRKINRYLAQVFDERQIYRIDHYLGKELVGNIAFARFTNRVLEPLWNAKHIESVTITLSETIGIENRGSFYDACGAIKDMVQSHMLQLLALTAMEAPKTLTALHIRDAKAKVLKKVSVAQITRGQYEGYTQEPQVEATSTTETYAHMVLHINNKRWKHVPFHLYTGKFLQNKESSIVIRFKQVKCLLTSCPSEPNSLTIRIQPNEGLYLTLNAKVPGSTNEATPVPLSFSHSVLFGPNSPEGYEILLADIVKGDQAAFVRSDEVERSWFIVEQALKRPEAQKLIIYKKGSPYSTLLK